MSRNSSFVSSGDLVSGPALPGGALNFLNRGDVCRQRPTFSSNWLRQRPAFATAWFALGAIRDAMGDRNGAIVAFGAARDADIDDYLGARLHLARLGVGEATPSMSAQYVHTAIRPARDELSIEALVERLDYRGAAVSGRAGGSGGRAASVPLGARSRLRHRACAVLRSATSCRQADRRRRVGRHDRAGPWRKQSTTELVVGGTRPTFSPPSVGARHDVCDRGGRVRVLPRSSADCVGRNRRARAGRIIRIHGRNASTAPASCCARACAMPTVPTMSAARSQRPGWRLKCIDSVSTRTGRGDAGSTVWLSLRAASRAN